MTYPNDDRPLANRNRANGRMGSWVLLAICVIAVIVAAVYYSDRNNTTASNTNTSPTTTGSNASNPGAPPK